MIDELLVRYVEPGVSSVAENIASGNRRGWSRMKRPSAQRRYVIGERRLGLSTRPRQAAITKNSPKIVAGRQRSRVPMRQCCAQRALSPHSLLYIEGTKMADGKSFRYRRVVDVEFPRHMHAKVCETALKWQAPN